MNEELLVVSQDTIAERKCCKVVCKCLGENGVHGGQGGPGRKVGELR